MYIISTRVDVCRKCWESYSLQSRHQRLQTEAFLKVFLEAVPNPWIERISVSIRSTLCGIEYIIYIFFFFLNTKLLGLLPLTRHQWPGTQSQAVYIIAVEIKCGHCKIC